MSELLDALTSSSERLRALLTALTDEQVEAPSYDTGWNIGAVASHLGSGAEIFSLVVDAGVNDTKAPDPDASQPIWSRWNAKSAVEQVRDALVADATFVEQLKAMTAEQWSGWSLELFGETRTLDDVARMRLAEHTLHTWDIEVSFNPSATLAQDAVVFVLPTLPALVARAARPAPEPFEIDITITDLDRAARLSSDNVSVTLTLEPSGSAVAATLTLPAEALIRLVYGRLDEAHCPAGVRSDGIELDALRAVFPGL